MRSAVILASGLDPTDPRRNPDALRQTVAGVRSAVDEVVVSSRDRHAETIESALTNVEFRLAVDPVPDGGSVADIRSGCRVARGQRTFVTDCTASWLSPAHVDRLFDAAIADGAVSRIDGTVDPLVAVYDTDAIVGAADTTLGMGARTATQLLDRVDVATVAGPSRAHSQ